MAKNTAIIAVANIIKKLNIQSDFHFISKQNFYYDKKDEIHTLFYEYHVTLLNNLDHANLIE